jgi:hypothetical protein
MLFSGTLNEARREGVAIKMFIETPEASLHPKRTSKWMCLFNHIKDEYYPDDTQKKQQK